MLDLPEYARLGFGSELAGRAVRITPESGLDGPNWNPSSQTAACALWGWALIKPDMSVSAPPSPEHVFRNNFFSIMEPFVCRVLDAAIDPVIYFFSSV